MILADALSYASELRPQLIVSVATLTGAADVALGFPSMPYFARKHDEVAISRFLAAATQSGEHTVAYARVCQASVGAATSATNQAQRAVP